MNLKPIIQNPATLDFAAHLLKQAKFFEVNINRTISAELDNRTNSRSQQKRNTKKMPEIHQLKIKTNPFE